MADNLYDFQELFNCRVFPTIETSFSFAIFIVSYFVGMVFQESSNFFELLLYKIMLGAKKNSVFKSLLMLIIPSIDRVLMKSVDIASIKHHTFFGFDKRRKRDLSDSEIEDLRTKIKQNGLLNNIDTEDYNDRLYQICKAKASADGKTGRSDKDQSISSMARSLSLYSFLMMIITLVVIFSGSVRFEMNAIAWITAIVFAALFVLFLRRNKRFSEIRYVYILRSYLY